MRIQDFERKKKGAALTSQRFVVGHVKSLSLSLYIYLYIFQFHHLISIHKDYQTPFVTRC